MLGTHIATYLNNVKEFAVILIIQNVFVYPARPALYEAWQRAGKDVRKATHQEMRSLVCAQCHTEYYFIKPDAPNNPGKANYLMFPQDKGLTCEAAEEYYDSHT